MTSKENKCREHGCHGDTCPMHELHVGRKDGSQGESVSKKSPAEQGDSSDVTLTPPSIPHPTEQWEERFDEEHMSGGVHCIDSHVAKEIIRKEKKKSYEEGKMAVHSADGAAYDAGREEGRREVVEEVTE